ncbi:MAG: hypothetical protein MJY92_04485 [Bacteroidales bacterium]|nr:hypothetical protein [Bacteroidales bacterium]
MKKLVLLLISAAFCCISCKKAAVDPVEPQLDITFINTSGDWKLDKWKAETVPFELYIHLKAKKFVMAHNVGSMYMERTTGSYNLVTDNYGTCIRGLYDFTNSFWSHTYKITSLTASRMEWVAMDDPDDIQVFVRVPEFPLDL